MMHGADEVHEAAERPDHVLDVLGLDGLDEGVGEEAEACRRATSGPP